MPFPQGLRPKSVVLMGKNTMMKRSIRLYVEETGDEKWSVLLEHLVGNVGVIFTKGDLSDVREQIQSFQVRLQSLLLCCSRSQADAAAVPLRTRQ